MENLARRNIKAYASASKRSIKHLPRPQTGRYMGESAVHPYKPAKIATPKTTEVLDELR